MIVKNVSQIKCGITKNVGASVKLRVLQYVAVIDKYLGSIIDDLVITCDEIIDTAKIYYDTLH